MTHCHLPEGHTSRDCMYLLRNSDGMVPLPNTVEEANETLPSYFEFGILNGHSLLMLEQIITQVSILAGMARHNETFSVYERL